MRPLNRSIPLLVEGRRAKRVMIFVSWLLVIFYCSALFAAGIPATTLPNGGRVIAGQAAIDRNNASMQVTQSTPNAIINWQQFNIGSQANVRFIQPDTKSATLNRVLSSDPSQILGSLSANGRVFLINPSGIVFGAGSRVDAGGFVASTLNMNNDDFLAGRYRFNRNGAIGSILNLGTLSATDKGFIALLAPEVRNQGVITARLGTVILGAAEKVTLNFSGEELVNVAVDPASVNTLIENKHLIQAEGGRVIMSTSAADRLYSSLINTSGDIRAQRIENRAGRIFLDSGAGGQTTISGILDVSSADGKGGSIIASGQRVFVKSGARLTASGATGGGEVLVGGSWQGTDNTLRQAVESSVEKGALLEANALEKGDGGTVVLWSDVKNPLSVTRAQGRFEARGGDSGGDGGRIETSGYHLDISGVQVEASAPKGRGGLWLIDPTDVTIDAAYAGNLVTNLNTGTDVTVQASSDGNHPGNITVSAPIATTGGSTGALNLIAPNDIILNAGISLTGAGKALQLNAGGAISGSGPLSSAGTITQNTGTNSSGTTSSSGAATQNNGTSSGTTSSAGTGPQSMGTGSGSSSHTGAGTQSAASSTTTNSPGTATQNNGTTHGTTSSSGTNAGVIPVNTLPIGGSVASGQAAITQSNASMQINQSTQNAILNWTQFHIGSQASVRFNQPDTTSATLNRVLSSDPSQILGSLSANGALYLINPSGIIFGAKSRVDAGSFVASTLNMNNEDFLASRSGFNRNLTSGGSSTGISSSGGTAVSPGTGANSAGTSSSTGSGASTTGTSNTGTGTQNTGTGSSTTTSSPGTTTQSPGTPSGTTSSASTGTQNSGGTPNIAGTLIQNTRTGSSGTLNNTDTASQITGISSGTQSNTGTGNQNTGGRSSSGILNQGTLSATDKGTIALIAPVVSNEGVITTQQGTVVLAAGGKVTFNFSGKDLVNVAVDPASVNALIDNKGLIQADGGRVILSASAATQNTVISSSGTASSPGTTTQNTGTSSGSSGNSNIEISNSTPTATQLNSSTINNSGIIRAQGWENKEGSIFLDSGAGGQTTISGTLDASSASGKGGSIIVTGERVLVQSGAHLTASGATGGGEVLVGGSWQGKNPSIRQAVETTVEKGARLEASARLKGDGGTVEAWSNVKNPLSVTRAYGTFEAKGGLKGGDGGRIETSGRGVDYVGISVSAAAPAGRRGYWLIDPDEDIDQARANSIAATLSTTDVRVNAFSGRIKLNDNVSLVKTAGGDATLTFWAQGEIILGAGSSIRSTSNKLHTVLWADSDNSIGGYISLPGTSASPVSINTNGGHLWMGGGSGSTTWNGLTVGDGYATGTDSQSIGVFLRSTSINTNGGNIALYGDSRPVAATGGDYGQEMNGIRFGAYPIGSNTGVSINSGTGTVYLKGISRGISGGSSNYAFGVEFDSAGGITHSVTSTATASDAITIIGEASGASANQQTRGVAFLNGSTTLSSGGGISITGTGGTHPTNNEAIYSNSTLNLTGTMTLDGGGGSSKFDGVIAGSGGVTKEGTGTLTLSAQNTFTGTLTVNNGTLKTAYTNNDPWGTVGHAGAIVINNGGTIDVGTDSNVFIGVGNSTNPSTITVNSGGTLANTSGSTNHLRSQVILNGGTISSTTANNTWGNWNFEGGIETGANTTSTISGGNFTLSQTGGTVFNTGSNSTLNVSSVIFHSTGASAPDNGLIKQGAGTLTLSGANTYTSATTVSAGTLQISGSGSIASSSGVTDAGTLDISATTAGATIKTLSGAGGVTLGSKTLTLSNANDTFSGVLSGTGGLTLSAGTETLSGANTYTGATTINGGTLALSGSGSIASSSGVTAAGTLDISATTAGATIKTLSGAGGVTLGSKTLTLSNANDTFSGVINGTGGLTLSAGTETLAGVNTYSGATTINGGTLSVSSNNNLGTGNLILGGGTLQNTASVDLAARTVTVSADSSLSSSAGATLSDGVFSASGRTLTLTGGGSFSLTNTGNDFGTVIIPNAAAVSLIDSNALTLGAVSATGLINIATLTGNLTLTGAINTSNTSLSAINLNAERNKPAGDGTGGNIIVTGGSVSTGAGGRAALFTGSIAGSNGLTALIGAGSGHFRYNSDESTSNYTQPFGGTGSYAIYREQPTLTILADNKTETYGTMPPALTTTVTGFQNGDTFEQAINTPATVTVGGPKSTSNNYTAGNHALTPSGAAGGLGYGFRYEDGMLTVNPKNLRMIYTGQNKVYDGNTEALVTGNSSDIVSGDIVSFSQTAAFSDKNAGAGKSIYISGIALGGTDGGNYSLQNATASTTANIDKANLTITANNIIKNYGQIITFNGSEFASFGLLSGETIGRVSLNSDGTPANASLAGSPYAILASGASGGSFDPSNYTITYLNGQLTVNPMPSSTQTNAANALIGVIGASANFPPQLPTVLSPPTQLLIEIVSERIVGEATPPADGTTTAQATPVETPAAPVETSPASDTPSDPKSDESTPPETAVTPTETSPSATPSESPATTPASTDAPASGRPTESAAASPTDSNTAASLASGNFDSSSPAAGSPAFQSALSSLLARGVPPAEAIQRANNAAAENAAAARADSSPQASLASGNLDTGSAEAASPAFQTALSNLLARGVSPAEAIQRAKNAAAENAAAARADSSPQASLASGNFASSSPMANSPAFQSVLSSLIAKGYSPAEAMRRAENAAAEAAAAARADNSPQASLASGNFASSSPMANSPAFQSVLSSLIAKGYSPAEAMRRAENAAAETAAAARADSSPQASIASGNFATSSPVADDPASQAILSSLLAKGYSPAKAIQRAESAANESALGALADAKNPMVGFSSGNMVIPKGDSDFDQALSNALGRGIPPAEAMALAQRMVAMIPPESQTLTTALATGKNINSQLGTAGSSPVFELALGNALARGMSIAAAVAYAKKVESAAALRLPLPPNLAKQIPSDRALVKVTDGSGKPLPNWIRYEASSKSFIVLNAPPGALPMEVAVLVGGKRTVLRISEGMSRR